MDKVMTTILLLVGAAICALLVINSVYPAINRGTAAMVTIAGQASDRVQSQIEIIQTANEGADVYIWVKNVGTSRIVVIEQSDVFFGPLGDFSRIPYGEGSPYWTYQIENDSEWMPMSTLRITVHLVSSPASDTYYAKVIIPNGISEEHTFGI